MYLRAHRQQGTTAPAVETLEFRRLMSGLYGTNLIVNPGAEQYTGTATAYNQITPTGWTANGNPTVVPYGTAGFPTVTDPGPSSRGKVFFSGGPSMSETDLFQTINLSSIGSDIDSNQVKLALSAYLGGYSNQSDNCTVFINFQNASKGFVSQVTLGPETATQRKDVTGLFSVSTSGTVPAGTRFAQVQLHFERDFGNYNDGYADNLSLVLTAPKSKTGTISGTVFNDTNGNGAKDSGESGLSGATVFVDLQHDGKLDKGDPSVKTTSTGAYSFSGLAAGTYSIHEVVPATYRATTANPVSVTLAAGATVSGKNFGDSQTVLITGTVFDDANGNKKQDPGEAGIAGVVVYLDFNDNGQDDPFELKTTTNSTGNYQFVVPFGTYIIRQITPAKDTQTTAPGTVTLVKGAVSADDNFGDRLG